VVTEELLCALVRLHDVGRRLVLVSLEEEPSVPYSLPSGVGIYHLPASGLPFDEGLLGGPQEWAPEVSPPLRFSGGRG
jgi:hypothetical protein